MYAICEQLEIDYTLGMGMNTRLKKLSEELLQQAVTQWETTGQPQRLFTARWYQADSWPAGEHAMRDRHVPRRLLRGGCASCGRAPCGHRLG